MLVIIPDAKMPRDCYGCNFRCSNMKSRLECKDRPNNCHLKSVEGLVEKIKENCNYDNNDKLSDYSIDLDEVIDIIKEYCEVK